MTDIPHSKLLSSQDIDRDATLKELIKKHINTPITRGVLLFEGSWSLNGHLELDAYDSEFDGIMVRGDLTLEGSLIQDEMDFGPFLLVTGNLHARNVDVGGSEIVILGDAQIEHVVYGFYNHGSLIIGGDLCTEFLINSDHFIEVRGKEHIRIACIGDFRRPRFQSFDEARYKSLDTAVVPELLEDEETIDRAKLSCYLRDGRSILLEAPAGEAPSKPRYKGKILEAFRAAGEDPNAVLEVDLTRARIERFPEELFDFPNLKVLKLRDVLELPNELRQFQQLEEFFAIPNLEAIPGELFELPRLRILEFEPGPKVGIPEAIGVAGQLAALSIHGRSMVPDSIARLQNLRSLSLSAWCLAINLFEENFPRPILQLKGLKYLDLQWHTYNALPEELTELAELEELRVNIPFNMMSVRLPDFKRLPRLRRFHLAGKRPRGLQNDIPVHWFEQIFEWDQLEELHLNQFDNADYYSLGRAVPMTEIPESIGRLENLEVLDLSCNDLRKLPESIYGLKHLKTVNLDYNTSFPLSEAQKLRDHSKAEVIVYPSRSLS